MTHSKFGLTLKQIYFTVSIQRRREILLEAFASRKIKGLQASQTPFATLVKKLQESLTRMESFDVITVAQNSDGKSTSSSSLKEINLPNVLRSKTPSEVRPRCLHVNSDSDLLPVTTQISPEIFTTL